MKAIILTAGYGRRMHPLTLQTHKALLKIGEKSLIQTIIEGLLENNIHEFVIVVGFQADLIKAHLQKHFPNLRVQYVHNERFAQTNNIVSMNLAFLNTPIDQDVILIECDLIYEPKVLTKLIKSPYANVALVDRYRTGMDGTVVSITNHVITDIITPQRQGADFSFHDKYKTINMYKFSKEFCSGPFKKLLHYYSEVSENAYYELVLGILIYMRHEDIFAEVIESEKWIEIDTPNDLATAKFMFDDTFKKPVLDNSYGGYWSYPITDFCFIRNMYFPTGAIFSELKANLMGCLQNYGSAQSILNQKLSYFVTCQPERLIALNGASQAFPMLEQFFENKRVLIPSPSFGEYRRCFAKADTYSIEADSTFLSVCEAFTGYEVVVIVNPNNPTGTIFSSQDIYQWAQAHPETVLIIDESFIEFSEQESLIIYLENKPLDNILILKSLSKNLGVPGLRLGYLYTCNTHLFEEFIKKIPIWNLNSMAEYFIEILLRHRSSLEASYKKTIEDRKQFIEALSHSQCVTQVYPSGANFILIQLKTTPEETENWAKNLLDSHQIYIKVLNNKRDNSGSFIRLAVRLPQENQKVVSLLPQLGGTN